MSEHDQPVGAIFTAAIELPLARRAAYLREACAGDDALRQRVEALLRAHESAESFMGGPGLQNITQVVAIQPTEQPGDRIGRYKLLQQIGEGGCGVVYMAEQEEPVRRRVALKVIKLGMDTKSVIARFEAERQALAMMDHPNIAKVLDAGATEAGRPYFVMELVRGIKITDYCNENNLSTQERLDLFMQVCRAIQHAHQKGIIHRDIKPSNILVTMSDTQPLPKVIDFGIAKATHGKLTDQTLFTAFEQFIGTPAYMSPEQAVMSALDIDTRSDIYSLGVLLYELLTGQTPFDAKKLLQAGLDEIRRTIREQEPARPSTCLSTMQAADLTAIARQRKVEPPGLISMVRGDLDWIVMKALEKDRTRRYETATGLAADIQRHLSNEAILARPPTSLYRFQKLVRRNKLAAAAAAAVTSALLIGLGVSYWMFLKEKAARQRAVASEETQRQLLLQAQAAEAEAASESKKARIEAERAKAAATEIRMNMSDSDFALAVRLIAEDKRSDALAYLARSLSNNPTNEAAATRLTTLLDSQSWWLPMKVLRHGGHVQSAQFSPDGRRIVTASWDHTARVWDAQSGQPLTEPLQHGRAVTSAQFSPDGRRIVTASWDHTARVWDAQSGQPLTEPLQHGDKVASAQFSPDGKRIVTASWDHTARVWDAQSGQPLTGPLQHGNYVWSAKFSPDGKRIVTASGDQTARVWDAQSGQPLSAPLQHGGWVVSAQFSPDGKRIVTASEDKTARVWDAQSGQPLTDPLQLGGEVHSAQFSPDGKRIVTASQDHTARVWDAQSGKPMTAPLKHDNSVHSAQFSPDGKRIITASSDRTARVWDAQSGQPLTPPLAHGSNVVSAQFSPDGKRIVTASEDKTARVWDAESGQPLTEPLQHGSNVWSAQFSPDGKRILTASRDHTARVWDAQSGQPLTGPLQHGSNVWSPQFSPDGKRIFTASGDYTARVWDAQSGQPLSAPLQYGRAVTSAQFSPDGKRIATVSGDAARVWDAQSGQPLTGPLQHGSNVWSAQFSPDGKRIVTASEDKTARVWDAQSGQPLTGPLQHGGWVVSAQFSPDGKRIVTGSMDRTARVWDAQSGLPLIAPLQHGGQVILAQFSPDGKRIVTASQDHTARVWDAQSGQPLTGPLQHGDLLLSAQFSPDGTRIVTGSWDQTARVWDAQSGQPLIEPLEHGSNVLSANFSPDGKRIVTVSMDGTARVWDVSPSPTRHPAWFLQLAEVISGQRLSTQGLLEPTRLDRAETISRLRQTLNQEPDDDEWAHWGRWFLADPATRTISPFSTITVPQYVENRIKEYTAASLAEAESLAVGNTEMSERVAQARQNPVYRLKQAINLVASNQVAEALAVLHDVEAGGNAATVNSWLRQVLANNDGLKLKETAWILSSANDAKARNGEWAVIYAQEAVAKTERKDPRILDTLAASYAEAGQFDKAVSTQNEAIALVNDETEITDYKSRLKLYEAKTPYRQPAAKPPP
jgi:WD40 repeat protein/serine/threonine protein kinase